MNPRRKNAIAAIMRRILSDLARLDWIFIALPPANDNGNQHTKEPKGLFTGGNTILPGQKRKAGGLACVKMPILFLGVGEIPQHSIYGKQAKQRGMALLWYGMSLALVYFAGSILEPEKSWRKVLWHNNRKH